MADFNDANGCCDDGQICPIESTDDVNPNRNECTVCNGDLTMPNIWLVPRAPGFPPRCVLDELTYNDVYWVLLKNPNAAADLMKITTDPALLTLARETKLVQPAQDDDEAFAKRLNANTIPFYTVFRGNIDGSVI